jgi:serine/threonine protein kinase
VALLGQPPATHAQLDTQQQLAEAIRQRQQREGLVVVPWETISFTQTHLAKGAFGTVALATLSQLGGMQCAVKIADVRSGDGLGEALALLNEGSFMNINHPNIVKTLGITFDAPAKIGLIMEIMTCSLHELIHAQALRGVRRYVTWADSLLAIATDIAFGMTFLHYHDLIHRDLKPLNVLMSGGWMAKVADFGEMKRIEGGGDADARAAGSGRIHGTPSYVSPEAASVSIPSAPWVGTPTDVWSFGCLLAHCAAHAAPYTDVEYLGRGLKPQEVVQWLLDGRANPLSMVVEGQNMPALLMDMARECTRVVPEQRPTFAHLAARLSTPTFIREICFKDAVIDEDEEEDLEARRPPVKLIVPTTEVLKDPSNARFREELSRGSSAKPEAEAHACVIS